MIGTAQADAPALLPESLAAAFRVRVRALHDEAERSGIVQDILRRRGTAAGYALLLRNLLPVYRAMERGLERHRGGPLLRELADPAVFRGPAIEWDLVALAGPAWERRLPLLAEAHVYARRIANAAEGDGSRLIAHAYARYMGDLSGGQILCRLLAAIVPAAALSMYAFPGIADLPGFKVNYRAAIDRAGGVVADPDTVVEEAAVAFRLNIDLSEAVRVAAADVRCLDERPPAAGWPIHPS
jgi:heme oxygenase